MKIVAAVFALAVATHLPPACAATAGRVTQGQLGYTLVDLDPDDAIVPSLVFEPLPNPDPLEPASIAHGSVHYILPASSAYDEQFATGTEPLVLRHDLGAAGAVTGRLDGRDQPGTQALTIEASANGGPLGPVQVGSWMYIGDMAFTLSARTRVEFHTTVQVQARVTGGADANEWFQSASWMYLMLGRFPDTTGFDWDHEMVTVHANPDWGVPRTVDTTLTLSVAYDNTGLEGQYGTVSFNTWADAVSAVPEPHGLPMALAGLAALAAWRRRVRH